MGGISYGNKDDFSSYTTENKIFIYFVLHNIKLLKYEKLYFLNHYGFEAKRKKELNLNLNLMCWMDLIRN